jgi:predicted metal-dependent phosphoesterase TrpH
MIDLHMHSTASDGTCSPTELVEKIAKQGIKAASLTDHDVVDGCEEFTSAASKFGIIAINGSELSADYPRVPMEILALDIPNKSLPAFKERQKIMIEERFRIARERLFLLDKLGIHLEWEDVAYYENGQPRNQLGKPHIVGAMLKKGYIKTWDEGFDKYLNRGCPAHVIKKEPLFKDVISFVLDNGAVPILAHPIHTKRSGNDLFNLLEDLKSNGLKGVEVFHSDHDAALKRDYMQMIEALNLLSSGGSDFHGGAHPEVNIGVGKGDLHVPDVILDGIVERITPTDGYYSELKKFI